MPACLAQLHTLALLNPVCLPASVGPYSLYSSRALALCSGVAALPGTVTTHLSSLLLVQAAALTAVAYTGPAGVVVGVLLGPLVPRGAVGEGSGPTPDGVAAPDVSEGRAMDLADVVAQ